MVDWKRCRSPVCAGLGLDDSYQVTLIVRLQKVVFWIFLCLTSLSLCVPGALWVRVLGVLLVGIGYYLTLLELAAQASINYMKCIRSWSVHVLSA